MFLERNLSLPVYTTFQPSNGRYGSIVRESYATGKPLLEKNEHTYLLLDRHEVLIDALVKTRCGVNVISDRHYYSMAAYQSYNKPFSPNDIIRENTRLFDCLLAPDLSIILDLPLSVSKARCRCRGGEDANDANYALQRHCKKVFDKIAGNGIVHIDASRALMEVYKDFEFAILNCIKN